MEHDLSQMRHDDFATERSVRQINRCMPAIVAGLASHSIRNAELKDARDSLSRAVWDERDAFVDKVYATYGRYYDQPEHLREAFSSLTWAVPSGIHEIRFMPKKLAATLKKIPEPAAEIISLHADATRFHERWMPVLQALDSLKAVVVMGRVIGDRKTPERTIDNTGSCCVCDQNVKLRNDKAVDHGYEVHWYSRHGQCFGVGYPPFEMSPVGLDAFIENLGKQVDTHEESLRRLNSPKLPFVYRQVRDKPPEKLERDHPDFEKNRQIAVHGVEGDIRQTQFLIKMMKQRRETWEAKPLPDGRRDHLEAPVPGP